MKSCSNSLVFVVNAKRSCGSWSHKWVLVCITLQSEPKESNCILQPNYILSEKSSIIILLDASVSMWMNAVMRMLILDAVAQQGGRGARPPPRNWVHKKIPGCAVELNTQNCAWFGSQISLITAMNFREAMSPEPPTRGSAPGPRWGISVPQIPCAPTSKSWLRHCLDVKSSVR